MDKADREYFKEQDQFLLKPQSLDEIVQMVKDEGRCVVFLIDIYRLIYNHEGKYLREPLPSYIFASKPQQELLSWMDSNNFQVTFIPDISTVGCYVFQYVAVFTKFQTLI